MQDFAQSAMQKTGLFELNAVVTVAAHRNFRRAAAALALSPSALSHAIAALEKRMGVRLFNRTTRSVSLTEAGEAFLHKLTPALHEIDQAMESINSFRSTPSGTLRLNTSIGAAEMILTPIVLQYLQRYPEMRVDIVTDNRLVDIVAGGFDAGIRLAEGVPQNMIAVPCTPPLRFAVVGSPDYFAHHPAPRVPGDLPAHRCIRLRFPSGAIYRWELERHGEALQVEVNGPLTLDSHRLIIEAALHGAGLAMTNEFAVGEHLASGRLIRVLEDWTPACPGLCIFYPAGRLMPAGLRAFVDLARELMAT